MNKQLINQLKENPPVLFDYLLDHGIDVQEECENRNLIFMDYDRTLLYIDSPWTFLKHVDFLRLLPIEDIDCNYPTAQYFRNTYGWVRTNKNTGYKGMFIPAEIFNLLTMGYLAESTVDKMYDSQSDAKKDLCNAMRKYLWIDD